MSVFDSTSETVEDPTAIATPVNGTTSHREVARTPREEHDDQQSHVVSARARDGDHSDQKDRHMRDRLKSLAEELVQTEERERRRLAGMLHDGIGQSLSLIHMRLRRWENNHEESHEEIKELRSMLEQVIRDTRALTSDLCPPFIHEISLTEAVQWIIDHLVAQNEIPIESHLTRESIRVQKELHVLLYTAVRELVLNCIKHAQAKTIRVEMNLTAGQLNLSVCDDGRGFPEDAPDDHRGVGLYHMRERFADFGVHLAIATAPHEGSTVTIHVPASLVETG